MKTFNLGNPAGQKKKPPRREARKTRDFQKVTSICTSGMQSGVSSSVRNESIHIEGKKKSPHFWGPAKKEVVGSKAYLEPGE